ncbi:unnamed protein product [Bursaphelenchus okinawaensis]|uniref:Uncharacterized protein n=1 Tax=Bursaphelenchus okinawaensis TaxID=465554 RepID=A0A811KT09_9BILA|nr:unnamed protein product [Bursaphelenchus okinawaensis]CAG9110600.1 unnamed protein product [Bursaphelenchus okinawaensis]
MGTDKSIALLQFRKSFSQSLKETNGRVGETVLVKLLPEFNKLMHTFTPDDLVAQFKESSEFLQVLSEVLVREIRKLANNENIAQAALAVYGLLKASPPDSFGWSIVKSVSFLINSGQIRLLDPICKASLPSTLVKVFYLFFDLPIDVEPAELEIRRRLYDSLVMLMCSLCAYDVVAEELIQRDDMVLLFLGAASTSQLDEQIWRDANFTFLCTIVQRAMNESVLKYIHSKDCVGHYMKQLSVGKVDDNQMSILLANLIDLLKISAEHTTVLIDGFIALDGFNVVVEFCTKAPLNYIKPLLDALVTLISAGNQTVSLTNPQTPLSFYPFQLQSSLSRSTATVRVPQAFQALEKCFYEGTEPLCLLVLDHVANVLKAEPMNYFILDKQYPLYLFVERMNVKSFEVQKKTLSIVENVLRNLNFIPCKELTSINNHLKTAIKENDIDRIELYQHFLFGIISANVYIKDAFRELLHLESFLSIFLKNGVGFDALTETEKQCTQRALDLLVTTTKGNTLNAQFVTENIEIKVIKEVLSSKSEKAEDFRNTTHVLVKNLLFSAKNEQLFSSLLQILFSDPGNLEMCMVILRLFSSVLLESHKVRIMFRRSGGYICLMTLLLQLEGSLHCTYNKTKLDVEIRSTLNYISMIFKVLTVSMRYEPSNARYFLNEVKVNIVISILRTSGAFSKTEKILSGKGVWFKLTPQDLQSKLKVVHSIFADDNILQQDIEMSMEVFAALYLIKLLFELGMDAFDKQTNDIQWAGSDWLKTAENIETIPLVTWSRSVIVHPTSVLCILQLLPSIEGAACRDGPLDEWSAIGQYYSALLLKALLRLERNQQIMCDHNMPKYLLDVGEYLFKLEKHLLLPPFHYLFERLACQSMHPRELRHFLRLDKPLCCVNLDDGDEVKDEEDGQSGGPLPIHRVKALVSMLTPRNHALVHPPAFVEFDMAIEGFAALFIPSLAHSSTNSSNNTPDRLFPPMNGLTFMAWLYLDETNKGTLHQSTDVGQAGYFSNIVRLVTIVRNGDGDMVFNGQTQTQHNRNSMAKETPALENQLTCLYVHFDVSEKQLVVCTEEHSMLDELRRDYVPPAPSDTCARIPLPDNVCALRQWTHLSVVLSRSLLKPSQIEVYINGRLLASQKLNYIQPNVGGAQAQIVDSHSVHGFIGTPPFLRRVTPLRWRIASTYLVEEVLTNDTIRKVYMAHPHYVGNFQCISDQAPLVPEEKILLSLTAASQTEFTLQAFRSMTRRVDTELCASLLGLSPNDNSTPVRFLWNCCKHAPGPQRSLGAAVVGYLGMRTFSPSPVSALLDSIGGAAPLLGLIAMCTDSQGLYASLKVLVSAVQTNKAVAESIERNRLYQTLAVLLEEKISLVNSHILHLILSLAGTVDLAKEVTVIPSQQTFEDLLCDLELWMGAPDEVKKLLFEHFYELVIDSHRDNLAKVRNSTLLNRLLLLVAERPKTFVVKNDIIFRLIGAIIQPPCDSASLLRFGQALVSTLPTQSLNSGEKSVEAGYPFHISELERLLLNQCNGSKEEENDDRMDANLYAIYVRNKLLNILSTTLAHTSGTVNSQLCENVVQTLGFGWIMTLCAPGIHTNTVFLALRTLLTVTKYQPLLQKFREGSANNGWLQDADSVLRNRAAVLLGFSVSAHGGAVGSHVDVNPELSSVSGLAALEQLICAHADQPFAYLAVLALLFNQHDANIQPIEEFNVDLIWSHVFALSTNSSVYDAIAKVEYCPEALIPIISMLRAGLHYTTEDGRPVDDNHWSRSYPIMVVQLLSFLYQNLENFVPLCHNETFVISLFTSLIPPRSLANTPQTGTPVTGALPANQRCAKSVLELLANILLNDLCLQYDDYRTDWLFDHLVEYLEGGGAMHSSQSSLFTELVNTCLDHFMASDMFFTNSSLNIPKSTEGRLNPTSEQTAINVVHFLSRVIDSVWNCLYRGNPVKILKCFLKLLAESHTANKAAAQLNCTETHLNALFRIVLYLLSRPIDNVDTQTSVVDTLAEIIRNQHILLSQNSNNQLYYGALTHLVFMLSEPPDIQSTNKHLERGSAQVSVCAQSVWGILWQQKKALMEEIFKRNVELDLYSARAACGEVANKYWLQFVDIQAQGGASTNSGPQSASLTSSARQVGGQLQHQIQSRLSRVARSGFKRLTSRKSLSQDKIFFQPAQFHYERPKVEPETFQMWMRVHVSLLKELMRTQKQRYTEWHTHVRKWCMQDWHLAEAELTRERGLWGPERKSELDKYQLDTTEGPCRVRKKLLPDPTFYQKYPYRPHLDAVETKSVRAKFALSKDSKLYYERMKNRRFHTMDERIVDRSQPNATSNGTSEPNIVLDPTTELNISMIKRMVTKNVKINEKKEDNEEDQVDEHVIKEDEEEDSDSLDESEAKDKAETEEKEEKEPEIKARKSSVNKEKEEKSQIGNGPDNQTLLRLLETGEQLHSMFRCARVQGLDTIEGLLLFGRHHFYVVDGFTLLKTREIRDLDFLPEQYHDPIIPYMAMGSQHRTSTRANRQCNKFAYEDIRDVHKRRYLLQPIALELFSGDGRNFLIAFPRKIRDRVHQKLLTLARKSSTEEKEGTAFLGQILPFGQSTVTQKWVRGEVSNFNYLMHLNTLAGRTYNDLSQYPVFPWILKDYESDSLDLTKPSTFRDLSRPMGAQTPERLAQFLKRYREWDDPSGDTPPYMYGTHYSSAMIVLSYLVRLEPFTQQFLKLQGGHFDLADRMFHSVGDAFKSAAKNNMADVKELIPEFFYLPEMFKNSNSYDLGIKQNGIALNDIVLPAWAHSDPFEFVRKHREALESDYVSEHLHEWIDLIFGFKQNGDAAKEANNVFHHLFYEENVDFESIDDPLTRNATLGFINNFGQTPTQLFKKPHPAKKIANLGQASGLTDRSQPLVTVQPTKGVTTPMTFYHTLETLRPSTKPVKELRAAVGDIRINDKIQIIVMEQNKMLIPPHTFMSWGFNDRSIRMGQVGSDKSICVLETNDVYEITSMETADGRLIFAGLTTGTVLVWTLDLSGRRSSVERRRGSSTTTSTLAAAASGATGAAVAGVVAGSQQGQPIKSTLPPTSSTSSTASNSASKRPRLRPKQALDAHTDVVTCLAACPAHNFLVSASRDQTAVIWHLTQLSYIRQLTGHQSAVTALSVNATTGDIATAAGSYLHLWTLNGDPLCQVNTVDSGLFSNPSSLILSLSFSTFTDWDPKNVIMCGTSDGLVKIYSIELRKVSEDEEKSERSNSVSSNIANDPTALKEHFLRRQKRIQSHQTHSFNSMKLSVDTSHDSQMSSPLHTPLSAKATFTDDEIDQKQETDSTNSDSSNKKYKWKRHCQLRRILTEHTAYHSENNRPAPITAIFPSKDHRQILVGDGVGRVWMWSIDSGNNNSSQEPVRLRKQPSTASTDRNSLNSLSSKLSTQVSDEENRNQCPSCHRQFAISGQPRAVGSHCAGVAQSRLDCKNCGQWFCENCITNEVNTRLSNQRIQICQNCAANLKRRAYRNSTL